MTDIKKLENEEFEEVAGGQSFHVNYIYKQGDRKSDPCKYCGAVDSLVYDRTGDGWENGNMFNCNIFKCEKCKNDNYFDAYDDHLLM